MSTTASHSEYDLVVRSGLVLDGTGSAEVAADIGVRAGRIAYVGPDAGRGAKEIDARDRIVTPGFVDIHTHYDGQAIWSDQLAPSSWHGVTTVVMGNCGVGFAPCRAADRDSLIDLMQGVEDIPGAVLNEGLSWEWETYPEYLDAVDSTAHDIDLCALVPHAALRVHVMGRRALALEPATVDDVRLMQALVTEAVDAGAFGVSTSRFTSHRAESGSLTPTILAREVELTGLLAGLADAGRGVFQVINESRDPQVMGEYEMIKRILARSGRPGLFSLMSTAETPGQWRELLAFADDAIAEGISLRPVVPPRGVGILFGLEASKHPFSGTATYVEIAERPLAERVALMRDPAIRCRILGDDPMQYNTWDGMRRIRYDNLYPLGDPPNYTPGPDDSVQAIAAREGRAPAEVAYDALLVADGMGFLYAPTANYVTGDLSEAEEMLANPNTIMGLGDGGAHVGFLLDAGFPTWLIKYWALDRQRFSLPEVIRRLTSDTAQAIGLVDRGRIALGMKADLNVIDVDNVGLARPYAGYDLPSGGKRLLQRATGYDATVVDGVITYLDGVDTGARPGRLVRSGAVASGRAA